MKKGKIVWVTRDRKSIWYRLWKKQPHYEYCNDIGWILSDYAAESELLCARKFQTCTGIKLKGGPKSIIKGRFIFVRVK